ncbi:MAG: hypothetical protein ACKOOE_00935 [Micrococcales bacterium]
MRKNVGDLGAGTVVSLGLITAVLSASAVLFMYTNQLLEQVRLESQTDNAAVAAADALRGLVAGYPCDVAKELAPVVSCNIVGNDVQIKTQRNGVSARARAGEPG